MGKNDPRDVCNNPGGKERLSGGRRQKPQSGWTEPRADSRVDSLIWKMKTVCWEGECPSDPPCLLPSSTTRCPLYGALPLASFTSFWTPSQWALQSVPLGVWFFSLPVVSGRCFCVVWVALPCPAHCPCCGHATAYMPSVLGWTLLLVGTVTGKAAMGTDASLFLLFFFLIFIAV